MIEDREIQLEGAHNVRDLGGVTTVDGNRVRSGKAFRADGLHNLTEWDIETLGTYGISTVVDLRSQGEIDRIGITKLTDHGARHLHFSLHSGDPARPDNNTAVGVNMGERYVAMSNAAADRFVATIAAISTPENLPTVFHCAAGKDRTGMIAALIYSILGVDRDVIVADYIISETNMPRLQAELMRQFPEVMARAANYPRQHGFASELYIRTFLESLDSHFGGPVEWLRQNGLSDSAMETLREEMLD